MNASQLAPSQPADVLHTVSKTLLYTCAILFLIVAVMPPLWPYSGSGSLWFKDMMMSVFACTICLGCAKFLRDPRPFVQVILWLTLSWLIATTTLVYRIAVLVVAGSQVLWYARAWADSRGTERESTGPYAAVEVKRQPVRSAKAGSPLYSAGRYSLYAYAIFSFLFTLVGIGIADGEYEIPFTNLDLSMYYVGPMLVVGSLVAAVCLQRPHVFARVFLWIFLVGIATVMFPFGSVVAILPVISQVAWERIGRREP